MPTPLARTAHAIPRPAVVPTPAVAAAEPQQALLPGETASRLADYFELFKIRVTGMVVLTAWAGFYLGSLRTGVSSMQPRLIEVLLGIGSLSAASAALNEILERRSDRKMLRTQRRPMAAGRIGLAHGLLLATLAAALGTAFLIHGANVLSAVLTLGTALTYVTVYTPLKRVTTLATFIGAFPGAMPPLLGWVAARGAIEWPGVALFALLFVWQFPHFMAISWLYREDYARAGIRMLPVVQPDGHSTVVEALCYAVLMVPVSMLPTWLHVAGRPYEVLAGLLSLVYLAYTIRFRRITTARTTLESKMYARDLLKVSVIYLPVLLLTLMLNAKGR